MTILHLHESVEVAGGAEVYIDQLQVLLRQRNYVSFWIGIAVNDDGFKVTEFGKEEKFFPNSKVVIRYLKAFVLENGVNIINIHSLFEPDIVRYCLSVKPVIKFSHSPIMVCPGRDKFWRFSERICDVKYGFHCFKHIYTEGCSNRHPKRILKAWRSVNFEIKVASQKYKKIVVMSDYIKGGLLECKVPDDKIVVNPYFTNLVSAPAEGKVKASIKRILFVGRIISSKGPHIMIKALSALLKTRNDLFLDIIGDGLMKEKLQQQVIDEGIQNKVVFCGWKGRDEVNAMLSECYLLLFPSIYPEAFGIAGIEAMMHGKPVIAFDVGGVSTWLEDGKTGFLLGRLDIDGMSQAVDRLLNDEQLYTDMASEARRVALQRFTPDIHLDNLVTLYRDSLL